MRLKNAFMGGLALGLLVLTAAAGSAAASTVPNPAVQGPIEGGIHGYP